VEEQLSARQRALRRSGERRRLLHGIIEKRAERIAAPLFFSTTRLTPWKRLSEVLRRAVTERRAEDSVSLASRSSLEVLGPLLATPYREVLRPRLLREHLSRWALPPVLERSGGKHHVPMMLSAVRPCCEWFRPGNVPPSVLHFPETFPETMALVVRNPRHNLPPHSRAALPIRRPVASTGAWRCRSRNRAPSRDLHHL
jgi:hypothetical protein